MMENGRSLFETLRQVQEHDHATRTDAVALLEGRRRRPTPGA
jgi:hypothetical protein